VTVIAQRPQEFGAATFVAPIGWAVEDNPRLQVFSWVRGPDRCMVVVTPEEPAPPGLSEAFAAAWQTLLSTGYRSTRLPASQERTSASGVRYGFGEGELQDANGNRLMARLHVFPLGSTSQWIVLLANGASALAGCRDSWDVFFASVRFRPVASEPLSPQTAGLGAADTAQPFENLSFVPPKGWTVRRSTGMVHLSATDVRGPERLEILVLSGRVAVSLERELEATWLELRSLDGAEQKSNFSLKR
jgi:hypothetical protein